MSRYDEYAVIVTCNDEFAEAITVNTTYDYSCTYKEFFDLYLKYQGNSSIKVYPVGKPKAEEENAE